MAVSVFHHMPPIWTVFAQQRGRSLGPKVALTSILGHSKYQSRPQMALIDYMTHA